MSERVHRGGVLMVFPLPCFACGVSRFTAGMWHSYYHFFILFFFLHLYICFYCQPFVLPVTIGIRRHICCQHVWLALTTTMNGLRNSELVQITDSVFSQESEASDFVRWLLFPMKEVHKVEFCFTWYHLLYILLIIWHSQYFLIHFLVTVLRSQKKKIYMCYYVDKH